jgi:peptide deformylase
MSAKYSVLKYGDPSLREKAVRVGRVDAGIRQLARDMLETMYASNGVGLAAEQVGRAEAVCVIDTHQPHGEREEGPPENPSVPMPLVLINPRIVESSGTQVGQEGCLSFPEIYVQIKRAAEVTVAFTDLDGRETSVHGVGLLARAIQHEVDHLNAVLLVDRMSAIQKVSVAGKLKRLKKESQS